MLRQTGFVDSEIGPAVDVFGGAGGEENARAFAVYGHAFLGHKPSELAPATETSDDEMTG
ncbi:hypothetical protein N9V91_03285 [Acidimicrobiaceae bacterium]|nr:hypothetical protein [Acidimicrobiaceae bacterium]